MRPFKIELDINSPLVKYRWWLFSLLILGIGFYEYREHPGSLVSSPLLIETFFFTILFSTTFVFSEALLRMILSRDRLLRELEFKDQLVFQLSMARDWDEFCQRLLEFPRSIIKVEFEHLLVYRELDKRFVLEASWPDKNTDSEKVNEIIENCGFCLDGTMPGDAKSDTLMRLQSNTSPKENCLIFRYGNKVIGILHFGLEDQSPLSHAIWERLESASLVVAPVLEAFNQKRELTAAQIADATRSERLAVAQDMHDTIGQNLCYLRLKLDQFSTPEGLRKSDDIRQDMELLRDTANESYELVRGALAILQLEDPLHFVELLQAQGVMIAERAKFEFMLDNVGAPRSLPPEIMRQTFFAMKEALTNISNHALASNVSVQLRWDDAGLTISIADDGIGFEPGQHKTNDHYGLSIMKKRIESVQGCFSVSSTPNVGTDVNIWVPYAMKQQSRLEIQI